MYIAIDFDCTIVGEDMLLIPGARYWLREFVDAGAKLILNTVRSGEKLQAAVDLCRVNGITLYGVNANPDHVREHYVSGVPKSPKVSADIYIDDKAFGCPLLPPYQKPYVDWSKVGPYVKATILRSPANKECESCAVMPCVRKQLGNWPENCGNWEGK